MERRDQPIHLIGPRTAIASIVQLPAVQTKCLGCLVNITVPGIEAVKAIMMGAQLGVTCPNCKEEFKIEKPQIQTSNIMLKKGDLNDK